MRHVQHAPSRRDITQPPEDLSWRTSRQLVQSLAIVATTAALAIFIFTPEAEHLAHSPIFPPLLMSAFSMIALRSVWTGIRSGSTRPFVRGLNQTYYRDDQPRRFWASIGWNALLGILSFFLSFSIDFGPKIDALTDRCFDVETRYSPQAAIAACSNLLAKAGTNQAARAEILGARGSSYHRLGDYRRAIADYSAAIGLDRENADAYLNRGMALLDNGKSDGAVADLTKAHELSPKDPFILATRGMTYAWRGQRALAKRDLHAARAIDPSIQNLLRGEALLSFQAGDMAAAVSKLTSVLERYPDDQWSLETRARAYDQLGRYDEKDSDVEKLIKLRADAGQATSSR